MVREAAIVTAAMVVAQFFEVSSNTLIKTATTDGMSIFVFTLYSNLLALFFLLPSTLLYHRKRAPPSISSSIFYRLLLLSCLSTAVQTLMNTGIGYSSPTLSSAMVDLVPAFTFILAIISRMEYLNLKLHSSQAKIIGTMVSIAGALIVTLYKGIPLISGDLRNIERGAGGTYLSVQSDWIFGGFLLAIGSFCHSALFIVQLGGNPIHHTIVTLVAEGNLKAWILRTDKELIAVCFSAIFMVSMRSVVYTWAFRKKGQLCSNL